MQKKKKKKKKKTTTSLLIVMLLYLSLETAASLLYHHEEDGSDEFPTDPPVDSRTKTGHCFDILTEAIDPCWWKRTWLYTDGNNREETAPAQLYNNEAITATALVPITQLFGKWAWRNNAITFSPLNFFVARSNIESFFFFFFVSIRNTTALSVYTVTGDLIYGSYRIYCEGPPTRHAWTQTCLHDTAPMVVVVKLFSVLLFFWMPSLSVALP